VHDTNCFCSRRNSGLYPIDFDISSPGIDVYEYCPRTRVLDRVRARNVGLRRYYHFIARTDPEVNVRQMETCGARSDGMCIPTAYET
jgi:hypothetical protein